MQNITICVATGLLTASFAHASSGILAIDGNANGLSQDGRVAAGVANGGLAAYWNDGSRIELGFGGYLNDTSSSGRYLAGYSSISGSPRGFVYDRTNGTRSDVPQSSTVNGDMKISSDGSTYVGTFDQNIISRWRTSSGTQPLAGMTGMTGRTKATNSDGTTIAGDVYQSVTRAFVWNGGSSQFLPPITGGTNETLSSDMNDVGDVIVGTAWVSGMGKPVRWSRSSGGTWSSQSLGMPNTAGGRAIAVTADGNTIAGYGLSSAGDVSGFIWTSTDGLLTVNQYAQQRGVNLNGWRFAYLFDISSDGRVIVGTAYPPSSSIATGFILTVPSPATSCLFLTGTAGVFLRRRRRVCARVSGS